MTDADTTSLQFTFKGGAEVERVVGAVSAADLAAMVERHLEGAETRELLTVA